MITARIRGVTKEIFTLEQFTEDVKRELINYSSDVLRSEIEQGFSKEYVVRVDNKFKAPIKSVKPFGKIEYINTDIDIVESLIEAYDILESLSPRNQGKVPKRGEPHYRDQFWVFLEDSLVATNKLQLVRWATRQASLGFPPGVKVTYINAAPYSRKLEYDGIKAGKDGSNIKLGRKRRKSKIKRNRTLIPRGVFNTAQRRFKNIFKGRAFVSNVKFRPRLLGQVGYSSNVFKTGKGRGRPYLYPEINIYPIAGRGVGQ